MRFVLYTLIFLAIVIGFGAIALWVSIIAPTSSEHTRIHVNGVAVDVLVADTPAERRQGLSGHPGLEPEEGMLFAFDRDGDYRIWMKDMRFALDIMWIEEDGTINTIRKNVTPDTYPQQFGSTSPARYVLEVPAGFVDTHRVRVGSRVNFF